ncbi:protein MHF1 homolog [Pyrus communis]|uniref:protein MHF1 homolog n=1 Tax=Pyrus communis TaxID=23211 RepID=UPI0035C0D3BA
MHSPNFHNISLIWTALISFPVLTSPNSPFAAGKRNAMEISGPVMACIADLAFKYAEQLAKDLELFSQHGGRKTANMEDVILSVHRNEHLATLLRSFCNDLKAKEPQSQRKRKKSSKREDQATTSVVHIPDS